MNPFMLIGDLDHWTDLLVPVLVFVAVNALGGALLMAWHVRKRSARDRLQEEADKPSFDTATDAAPQGRLLQAVSRVGEFVSARESSTSSLKQALAKAGYFHRGAVTIYLGAKVLLLFVGIVSLGGALTSINLSFAAKSVLIFGGSALLFFVPNVVIHIRQKNRTGEIRHHLPDALDLLEICVSSGMGMSMAWNAVTNEVRRVCPSLADEMALTNLEMHLGAPRATALKNMAARSGVEEIGSLVATLVQSERFGTSIVDALCEFATTMRQLRTQRAEEKAEKMAVKLLFPMVLFIFPALLVVLVGPAGLKLAEMMGTY